MKKLIPFLLLIFAASCAWAQAPITTDPWKKTDAENIEPRRADTVRVPVQLIVGDRSGHPFPTYNTVLMAQDSVSADSHYVVLTGWLSVPMATTNLQHAGAFEIYYTAEADTQYNSLVGTEISVNSPGRLIFDRDSTQGVYGLVVNGKPTGTQGKGYMEGRRWTGVYVDLADVAAGYVDSVRFDTTVGVWVPRLDGGRDDSGFTKLGILSQNNIYCGDTIKVVDAFVVLGTGADSAWIKPDSIVGPNIWAVRDTLEAPTILSLAKNQTSMLRLASDSGQVRILATETNVYFQVGDSAWTFPAVDTTDFYLSAVGGANLRRFWIQSDSTRFRGHVVVDTSFNVLGGTTGQVLKKQSDGTTAWDTDATAVVGSGIDSATGVAIAQEQIEDYGPTFFVQDGDSINYLIFGFGGTMPSLQTNAADSIFRLLSAFDTHDSLLIYGPIYRDTIMDSARVLTNIEVQRFIEDSLNEYSLSTHGHSLSDSLALISTLDGIIDTSDAEYADSAGAVDTANTTFTTYIANHSGGAGFNWLDSAVYYGLRFSGDSIYFSPNGTDSCKLYHDGTRMVFDCGNGPTVLDSVYVNNYLCWVNGADTTCMTQDLLDSMVNQLGVYAAGAGGIDLDDVNAYIDSTQLDTIQYAHKAKDADSAGVAGAVDWPDVTNKPTLMVIDSTTAGNGLIESANDLAVRPGYGIDTVGDLVVVDTANITVWFDTTEVVDTILSILAAAGYLTAEADPVWVSDSGDYAMKTWVRTEIEDSLDEYFDTLLVVDTAQALIALHAGAADPHTVYRLESADIDPDELAGDATNNDKVDSNLIPKVSAAVLSDSTSGGAARAELADQALTVPNSANPTTDADGEIAIDTNDEGIEIYDGAASRIIPSVQQKAFTIYNPSSIADTITVLRVGSLHAPFGIKLLQLTVLVNDTVGTYALQFEEWGVSSSDRARVAYIDTLTVPNNDYDISSTTFATGGDEIAVSNEIRIILPATVKDEVHGVIEYYVKEGN